VEGGVTDIARLHKASNISATGVLQAVLRSAPRSPASSDLLSTQIQTPQYPGRGGLIDRPATVPGHSRHSPKVTGGITTFDNTSG
jgi:hypothetical protein